MDPLKWLFPIALVINAAVWYRRWSRKRRGISSEPITRLNL